MPHAVEELIELSDMGVDPSKFGEWYEQEHVLPEPQPSRFGKITKRKVYNSLALILLVTAAIFCGPLLPGAQHSDSWVPVFHAVLFAVILASILVPWFWGLGVMAIGLLLIDLLFWRDDLFKNFSESWGIAFPIAATLVALEVLVYMNWPEDKTEVSEKYLQVKSDEHPFVHGAVGGLSEATDVFGEAKVAAGLEGERRTARLLETLFSDFKGATVYHGLRFPGSANADVDHAIVYKNLVIFIDSKMFAPGTYEWDTQDSDWIVGGKNPIRNHMASASESYAQSFPIGTHVYTLVVIHGKDIQIGTWDESQAVNLKTPQQAMDWIGQSLQNQLHIPEYFSYNKNLLLNNLK